MHGTCMIDSNILKSLRLKISQLLGAKPSKGNILRKMHLVSHIQLPEIIRISDLVIKSC